MRPLIIMAGVFCTILVAAGIFFGINQVGTTRSMPIDSSYTTRVQQGYWSKGTIGAPTVLTVYTDFQCEACYNEEVIIESALRQITTPVEFRFRQYPIALDDKSILASEAAEAAGRQGKFWQMYEIMYANRSTWLNESPDDFKPTVDLFTKSLGINLNQFHSDMSDSSITDPINADIVASNKVQASGTPAMLINDVLVTQLPKTPDELVTMLNDAVKPH